ncbi:NAD-dependent epimerase/dehydratase family protein [Georgenia alba]|uniref:NAD-dependent epimerase/dehydratase family protein n=1 Tax=Georgenia alba TaxID=2233858 RepID=A0ABW2QBT1_9MICO
MTSALVGHTGFVGSNFALQHDFDATYNTSNIADIAGKRYDLVVSAANRADSHRINHGAGQEDRAEIQDYVDLLSRAEIGKLVLVSTVSLYPPLTSPDEDTPVTEEGLLPYGANRAYQEHVLASRFDTLILRLPQLYGANLKKGIVYDLLNDYRVEHIRPRLAFQHYDLSRVWADTRIALEHGLGSLNVAPPPIESGTVAQQVFGRDIWGQHADVEETPESLGYTRDMRTKHGALFAPAGRAAPDGYLMTEEQELEAIAAFVARQRR